MIDTTQFNPITLEQMEEIRLMNRIDTKYLTDRVTLDKVLVTAMECGYMAFLSEGTNLVAYDTVYYDTANMDMFLAHHNRRLVRQKVRVRRYVDSDITFLEVKNKDNHSRTKKKRISLESNIGFDFKKSDDATQWLIKRVRYDVSNLQKSLEVSFTRLTLVNPQKTERTTIDLNVSFKNLRNSNTDNIGDAVIIELKQDSHCESTMKKILRDCRIKPYKVSKYCIGIAMTDDEIKNNRFIEKVRYIRKINKGLML